ncbi:MAG: M28 family peptidase [Acholeplasmatales bacterium]|nr:MAG: M28 family peptidase [Acholeplasmatales bacterium]
MAKQTLPRAMRQKIFAQMKVLIAEIGPRRAGTAASLEAAKRLEALMAPYADTVVREPFKVHSGAFLGWIRLLVIAYVLGTTAFWFNMPYVTIGLMLASLFILILQFIFYVPLLDRFYPRRPAENVIATIEPKQSVKETVIFSGHHDSARVFNFLVHQPALYQARVTGSIAFVMLLLFGSIWQLFQPELGQQHLGIVFSVGAVWVAQMWFFAGKRATPGAGDNLASTLVAVALGEYFSENRLQHTRVMIVSFDAEEEGLRGARAFAARHRLDLQAQPTYMLNFECLYDDKVRTLLTSDINGTVKLDQRLAQDMQRVAVTQGISIDLKPIAFLTGGTDAAELAKVGVSATTLFGMVWSNSSRASVYHTMQDVPENVSKKAIEQAFTLGQVYAENRDRNLK